MVISFDAILQWVFNHIIFIVAGGVILYYAYYFLKVRATYKILDRSEVERLKFIDRMKANKSIRFKKFYRGNNLVGLITHYRKFTKSGDFSNPRGNPKDQSKPKLTSKMKEEMKGGVNIIQMVIKPAIFGKIPSPFGKPQAFQINADICDFEYDSIRIPKWVWTDKYFGIVHDGTLESHTEIIKNDNVMRTDLNQLASIYFVKSQEQSTYDPIHAHALAMKEKELQIEMAKKRGKSESI